jgi:hypothetical protein
MAGLQRCRANKLAVLPRAFFLDAGAWHGREDDLPTMTFGLMEHNTLALCSYFCDGRYTSLPKVKPDLNYCFDATWTALFLSLMINRKYGLSIAPDNDLIGYHVKQIIPLPPQTLCDDPNEFNIFVPDLHLHYFKNTYLDNFITWYRNTSSRGRIHVEKLAKRTSMEYDFALFLDCVIEMWGLVPGSRKRLQLLGDVYELWETESVVYNFETPETAAKSFRTLNGIARSLWYGPDDPECQDLGEVLHSPDSQDVIWPFWPLVMGLDVQKPGPGEPKACSAWKDVTPRTGADRRVRDALHKFATEPMPDRPPDPQIQQEVNALYRSNQAENFFMLWEEDGMERKRKAEFVCSRILEKYHAKDGRSLQELLIKADALGTHWQITDPIGNHDNYLRGEGSNFAAALYKFEVNPEWFKPKVDNNKCSCWTYEHGHNMDKFNNDEACLLGRYITGLLTFYEVQQLGDLVRTFEEAFGGPGRGRWDTIANVISIFYDWDLNYEAGSKNKLMVLAHTHSPYLEEVTDAYRYNRLKWDKQECDRAIEELWEKGRR